MSEPAPALPELHDEDHDAPAPPRLANDQAGTVLILIPGMFLVFYLSQVIMLTWPAQPWRSTSAPELIVYFICLLVPVLYSSYWRVLGFIPLALTVILAIAFVSLVSTALPEWLLICAYGCLVATFGCICKWGFQPINIRYRLLFHLHNNISLKRYDHLPPFRHERFIEILLLINLMIVCFRPYLLGFRGNSAEWNYASVFQFFILLLLLTIYSWYRLNRHVYELWVESWARVMYKIRGRGAGMIDAPLTGPLLVIANHACWWDPLFLAGVLSRPITPMMTASFYDIWHLKPFMKYVVRAIRVPEKPVRRETPEILEAIAALDRGECVVIFPEGYLRRKEEVPLRRFGRGVHEILKARPQTPVIAAWIEGAWGSWCSWKNGPPMKNKRVDFRRKIEVGLAAPITVPAKELESHWATRVFLMNAVSRARMQVGLEPFAEFSVPVKGDAEESTP